MEMKLDQSRIKIDTSVLSGLDILTPEEREGILKAINSLECFSPDEPFEYKLQKGEGLGKTFYMLHATPIYRVIFEINKQNKIEVIDIFMKNRLELFR